MKHILQIISLMLLFLSITFSAPPTWSVVASEYQYNASITAVVLIDDIVNNDSTNILGAFVGDTVRGVATPIMVGSTRMFFLTVYSNKTFGDTITFRLFYAANDTILSINEKIAFTPDAQIGDPITPYQFTSLLIPPIPVHQYNYNAGWNIVSLACAVTDNRKSMLYPTSISDAFSFENGYQTKSVIEHGKGYWLKFPPDSMERSVTLQGYGNIIDTITVKAGWNMIGSISMPVPASTIISLNTSILSSYFEFRNGYQVTDTLVAGVGYWVKVSDDGKLVLHSPFLINFPIVNLNRQ